MSIVPHFPNPSYPASPDLLVRGVRTPKDLDPSETSFLTLRVRSKPWITPAVVHLSGDGRSYHVAAQGVSPLVGAVLLADLSDGARSIEVREVGEDAKSLHVLPDADWQAGQYVALIDDEWCFFRALRAASQDTWTLDGLLRGQFGTPPREHSRGAVAFLADRRSLVPIRDHLLIPGAQLWIKTQPLASNILPLPLCKAVSFTF